MVTGIIRHMARCVVFDIICRRYFGIVAQHNSVAIFGLTDKPNVRVENAFNSVCQLSGGILLTASPQNLAKQLRWFMTMVRGRYIVEFPHPVSTKPSHLTMEMTIAKSHAFIRPAGAVVSVDDPKILNDPMTVRPDASYAPQVGNRKVMTPHSGSCSKGYCPISRAGSAGCTGLQPQVRS